MRVKICGITNESDLSAATGAGADAVGFISGFPTSPRDLSLDRAGALMSSVPPLVDSVLVTNVHTLTRNLARVKRIAPDAIQLYGDLADLVGELVDLNATLIRPVLVGGPGGSELSRDRLKSFDAVLTDTYKNGSFGGTGVTSNWSICRGIREKIAPVPLILSGGLRPENVVAAIEAVGPYAVDSSSGVEESPGKKDHAKVRSFVRRAKESQ